jgi:hypothetical protein
MSDPELDEMNRRFQAASQMDDQEESGLVGSYLDWTNKIENRPLRFLYRLPTNMAAGAWKALGHTIDTASDITTGFVEAKANQASAAVSGVAKAVGADIPQANVGIQSLSEKYPDMMKSYFDIGEYYERGAKPEDDITVGMTQFAVPFLGWLKAAGGLQGATKGVQIAKAAGAEAVAAASAFDPQEGRVADLVQMGRELDGRFGDFMRRISPDGSLVGRYIDYMTNREDEGKWEGRFKNAVDSVVTTAAVAAFIKGAGVAYKKTSAQLKKTGDLKSVAEGTATPDQVKRLAPDAKVGNQKRKATILKSAKEAPQSGAGIVQTADKQWTVYVDRKPMGVFASVESAEDLLGAL